MLRAPVLLVLLAGGALSACAGGAQSGPHANGPIGPTPQPRTEAVLVGPLCQGDSCRCKQDEGDAGPPAPGEKRYEVHLGPSSDPLWATVDRMVLFKDRDHADACYYIDLAPGKHQVALRGKADAEPGLSVAMSIAEEGGAEGQSWWYRTFDFNCGAPGQCTMPQIQEWKEQVARWKGKHDPCGSTKVEDLSWETGRMPDRLHPDDLRLNLTLDVYKFTPPHPPGSSECDHSDDDGAAADPSTVPVDMDAVGGTSAATGGGSTGDSAM